ncbi:MAG TPA: acyltransferase [Puia sp.]|jgi:peptidoglycan/LPS O-acetylase OafA/YrhL
MIPGSEERMNRIYFKGLNGIRAMAAFIVITFHIDQFLRLFGLKSFGYHNTGMAGFGVTLFFVLSGYLITYLLLTEKKKYEKVDLLKFYKRRILRIWPIYYLAVGFVILLILFKFLIVPEKHLGLNLFFYIFLLSNVAYSGILPITPLWSIGVEEQFYLFWPLLLNRAGNVFRALLGIIVIYLAIKIGFRIFENGPIYSVIYLTSFDCMAIGGIMANYVFRKHSILKLFYTPLLQVIAWSFLAVSIFYKPVHFSSLFDPELHAVVYAIIIVNVSTNSRSLLNLENKLLNFLGRISYGLYVYHMLIIWLLSRFLKPYIPAIPGRWLPYITVYGLVYAITIFVAYLSYHYFESYFLKLKTRFAKIHSTNEARPDLPDLKEPILIQ